MPYKNPKVKVYSLDGDSDFFDIVAGVLQGDTLAPYLFRICLDIALLANTSAQAESLLYSLEQAVGDIGLHVNTDKTKYMCFNKSVDISILNGSPLKLVDKFSYSGSSVSSTENDINT